MKSAMVKNPERFKKYAESATRSSLRKLSLKESIRMGENLIRAAFKAKKPRLRRDNPMALSFYVHQSH
jgi:hypothetical protein